MFNCESEVLSRSLLLGDENSRRRPSSRNSWRTSSAAVSAKDSQRTDGRYFNKQDHRTFGTLLYRSILVLHIDFISSFLVETIRGIEFAKGEGVEKLVIRKSAYFTSLNMATFAWRLIADDGIWSTRTADSLDEKHIIQLKGIFLHYDEDKDGFLTITQLSDALLALGFRNRDKLLSKFSSQPLQSRNRSLHGVSFKTDLKTFIQVVTREVRLLRQFDEEFSVLLGFMDVNRTGSVSKRDLRHLLSEVETSSKLSSQEFTRFLRNLRFSSDTDSISIADLRRQILFQN